MAEPSWDAVVIGGGPAGSGVATHLAREGRRVLVIERERFPREHIGESLLPGVLPYLDALGARDAVERAGFERKEGQTFVWGGERPWAIDFRELDVFPYAFFVDRARFDRILLEHARGAGAVVEEGRTAKRVIFHKGRAVGVAHEGEGGERVERTRFVVDASGQSALVARVARLRRVVRGLKNVAFWAYWTGAARLPGEARRHILTASIPEGWVWVIPLGERTSVGIVTSASTKADRARIGGEAWYERTLRACVPAWDLLAAARRETEVRSARDWSYRSRRLSGPGILLAGDAACFIDPILSTGVHLAMSSATWAAACVHSSLAEPTHEPMFRRFYDETYAQTYAELLEQVKAFYRAEGRQDSVYWASKKVLRADAAVRPDLAFLFITSGLLRNAALPAPHDAFAQARLGLGSRIAPAWASPTTADAARPVRTVSQPLVWRTGPEGQARLVTVRQEGLRLSLVPHEPEGLVDRPGGSWFAIEIADRERCPFALVAVEERTAKQARPGSRLAFTLHAYPGRPKEPALHERLRACIDRQLDAADDRATPLRMRRVRVRLRKSLRAPRALPAGLTLAAVSDTRGGRAADAPLTAVFDAREGDPPVPRVYLLLTARVPPELTEMPVLRTRFLDLWVRPARAPDGRELTRVPEVARLIEEATRRLWEALRTTPSRARAFEAADAALRPPSFAPDAFTLTACGRLGSAEAQ